MGLRLKTEFQDLIVKAEETALEIMAITDQIERLKALKSSRKISNEVFKEILDQA